MEKHVGDWVVVGVVGQQERCAEPKVSSSRRGHVWCARGWTYETCTVESRLVSFDGGEGGW